jgi:dTDP-4-dehydrorhamnose reductase
LDNLILGDGLLGAELKRQTGWDYISRKKDGFDFDEIDTYSKLMYRYSTIINCIGNTDTYSPELEKHWKTNYIGVISLVDYCNKNSKKLVHISTDHLYGGSVENASENDLIMPAKNWYSYTKLISDAHVQALSKNYLMIRTSYKPNPFPYPKAITTQVGNFDYADVIASLLIKLISKGATGVYNVGTETKTIYELALKTNPAVIPWDAVLNPSMPTNVTMNTEKMRKFLNEN